MHKVHYVAWIAIELALIYFNLGSPDKVQQIKNIKAITASFITGQGNEFT